MVTLYKDASVVMCGIEYRDVLHRGARHHSGELERILLEGPFY
ncbi:unnamed protein product [Camellia sinensis]